jgi:hypothetical protein
MSIYETSITNPKKQLEFYKDLSEQLQKENKILKENAENNDKVVDNVNWENQLLKKENKQLKIQISAREEVCNKLESNRNKLREWVNKHYNYYIHNEDYIGARLCFTDMKYKMQELEQRAENGR